MTTPGPLVDVAWLADRIGDVVAVDCRWVFEDVDAGRAAHEAGHIPGAIYLSLDDDLSDMSVPDAGRHPLPTRADFAATVGRHGIDNGTTVVAYDDAGGAFASRLWWLLRWVGHRDVALLDGGLPAWISAGGVLENGPTVREPVSFVLGADSMPTVDRTMVASAGSQATVLDARGLARFRGEIEPRDPVAGHIPGAKNAHHADNLESGRFLDPSRLARRYGALGVVDAADAIVYCGSGVTACHDILAMEVAGLGTAALYPGSWSEWCRAGGEVATGD